MKDSIPLYKIYRQRLSQTELFRGLPQALLDDMLSSFRFETWNKGSVRDSSIALKRFYVIVQGRMELIMAHPASGKQIVIQILKEGDIFDVPSLLDGKQNDIIPVTLDDLSLLSAPLETVRDWIKQHPEFNKNFLPYLSKKMRDRETLVADLSLYDTYTRLARLILRYATMDDIPDETVTTGIDVSLLHDLSNEELAQMVGSARQVINRHLQTMKKQGILHTDNHHLIIDDLQKLQQQADVLHKQALNKG